MRVLLTIFSNNKISGKVYESINRVTGPVRVGMGNGGH